MQEKNDLQLQVQSVSTTTHFWQSDVKVWVQWSITKESSRFHIIKWLLISMF
jgi:hypothetical protein